MQEDLSQAIQNKAVIKQYRKVNSACSLYDLVNKNPEPFMNSDKGTSEDEDADQRQNREKLLKKVSCPLRLKVKWKKERDNDIQKD